MTRAPSAAIAVGLEAGCASAQEVQLDRLRLAWSLQPGVGATRRRTRHARRFASCLRRHRARCLPHFVRRVTSGIVWVLSGEVAEWPKAAVC
mgnify:CR=1 FL=1